MPEEKSQISPNHYTRRQIQLAYCAPFFCETNISSNYNRFMLWSVRRGSDGSWCRSSRASMSNGFGASSDRCYYMTTCWRDVERLICFAVGVAFHVVQYFFLNTYLLILTETSGQRILPKGRIAVGTPKICLFPWEILAPPTWFLGPIRVHTPNGTSIGSVIL